MTAAAMNSAILLVLSTALVVSFCLGGLVQWVIW
jgi:hypothetical protein